MDGGRLDVWDSEPSMELEATATENCQEASRWRALRRRRFAACEKSES